MTKLVRVTLYGQMGLVLRSMIPLSPPTMSIVGIVWCFLMDSGILLMATVPILSTTMCASPAIVSAPLCVYVYVCVVAYVCVCECVFVCM